MALQLLDDFSGQPLDRDHQPLVLKVGAQSWNLYLSDDSKNALIKALEPFTDTAEPIAPRDYTPTARSGKRKTAKTNTHGFDIKEVRAWAIAADVKNIKSTGEESPVGERGVLAQNVYDAYKEYKSK